MEQEPNPELDLTLLDCMLALTPQERLEVNDNAVREMLYLRECVKKSFSKRA